MPTLRDMSSPNSSPERRCLACESERLKRHCSDSPKVCPWLICDDCGRLNDLRSGTVIEPMFPLGK